MSSTESVNALTGRSDFQATSDPALAPGATAGSLVAWKSDRSVSALTDSVEDMAGP